MTPEARRAHILDAARTLFLARGWDNVTVSNVLQTARISKGGFYHHFAAKADLVDGMVERFTNAALTAATAAHSELSGTVLTRFNAFLTGSTDWKAEHGPEMRLTLDAMLQPGNDYLFHRVSNASTVAVKPILREMIADGVAEGCFNVPDLDIVTEAILALTNGRKSVVLLAAEAAETGNLEGATALLNDRMKDEGSLIDGLLGFSSDSIELSSPTEYRAMLRALTNHRGEDQ